MKKIQIDRSFHFYAAHRNENIDGKCRNIHGHTYDVQVSLLFGQKSTELTMLFDDIESEIEPIIKELDHALLMNTSDPLHRVLKDYSEQNEPLKIYTVDYETNVENLALHIGRRIHRETGLNIVKLALRETKSSVVTVFAEDIQIGWKK